MNKETTKAIEPDRCSECQTLHYRHHPKCSLMGDTEARRLLAHYYEEWLSMEDRRRGSVDRFRKLAVFWQGKWSMVRQENNALRRKLFARMTEEKTPCRLATQKSDEIQS